MKNITMHQTKAMAIQVPSTRSSGCFHHRRSAGGRMALTSSPSLRQRYGQDVDDTPKNVHHHRDQHADEEQQERVVQQLLDQRHLLGVGMVFVHRFSWWCA